MMTSVTAENDEKTISTCHFKEWSSKQRVERHYITNISGTCNYNEYVQMDTYSKISWTTQHQNSSQITRYVVVVKYEESPFICFFVPPQQNSFIFSRERGFLYKKTFKYNVISETVFRTNTPRKDDRTMDITRNMKTATSCPSSPQMAPLPHSNITAGSEFTFEVKFVVQPIPSPMIDWYFASEKWKCKRYRLLMNGDNSNNIQITNSGRTLNIQNVSEHNAGCFIVIANNGVGGVQRQKGYLGVHEKKVKMGNGVEDRRTSKNVFDVENVVTLCAALIVLVVLVAVFSVSLLKGFVFK